METKAERFPSNVDVYRRRGYYFQGFVTIQRLNGWLPKCFALIRYEGHLFFVWGKGEWMSRAPSRLVFFPSHLPSTFHPLRAVLAQFPDMIALIREIS